MICFTCFSKSTFAKNLNFTVIYFFNKNSNLMYFNLFNSFSIYDNSFETLKMSGYFDPKYLSLSKKYK